MGRKLLLLTAQLLAAGLVSSLLANCAADGGFASKSKPLDKEQTRLAVCDGAQKIDIAFQTIAAASPGLIPANVAESEKAFVLSLGYKAGLPDAASAGSACAKVYAGDLDVAINTAILVITNVSQLIKTWQPGQ